MKSKIKEKPFLDKVGEEIRDGDYVIFSQRLNSGHWISFGKIIGRYDDPLAIDLVLKVVSLEEKIFSQDVEIEEGTIEFSNQLLKIDKCIIPSKTLKKLDKYKSKLCDRV